MLCVLTFSGIGYLVCDITGQVYRLSKLEPCPKDSMQELNFKYQLEFPYGKNAQLGSMWCKIYETLCMYTECMPKNVYIL